MGSDFISLYEAAKLIRKSVRPENFVNMPYIGLENIEEGTLRLREIGDARKVTSNKLSFSKGDILFGKLRPYFRKVVRPKFDGICSTDIWVVRAQEGIDQGYLYYWLASNDFVDFATQGSVGTRMPRAKWEYVKRFKRKKLSKKEQRAIAHILGSLDDKIDLNRKMNETLEGIARAIFKSWFVDFDPVRAKVEGRDTGLPDEIADLFPDSFQDSELGEIPEGWEVKSLDDIFEYLNGLACQKYPPQKHQEAIPVIKIRELRQGISSNSDLASSAVPEKYIVEDGDILFSWSGSLMIKIWTGGKAVLNQHIFKIMSDNFPKWFYLYWNEYHLGNFQTIAASKATTMGHIKRQHLSEAKLYIPDETLLRLGDNYIGPVLSKMTQNRLESKLLMELRDALLPKLISGERRVPNVEKFIEEVG